MTTRCGTIAIVGRPNVGKSTLLNRIVGTKVSITSSKPQTTRHSVRGIRTQDDTQFIFVDTPGFQERHGGSLNRALNRAVRRAVDGVDVALLVIAAGSISPEDERAFEEIPDTIVRIIVANKSDRVAGPAEMLPFLARAGKRFGGLDIVPTSAQGGRNIDTLLAIVAKHLPEQPFMFDADDITDRDERFLAAESIREKLFRTLGDEIPYASVVGIESFQLEGELRRIQAVIYVDRESHKGIIVGAGGGKLKAMASSARRDLEKLFGGKVHLDVWVKARHGWADNPTDMRRFGLEE
ncbi:MAG: GTPase Era [Burkholderiales bacterium]